MLDSSDFSKDMVQVSTRALGMGVAIPGNVTKRLRTGKAVSTTPGWLLLRSGESESNNGPWCVVVCLSTMRGALLFYYIKLD